MFSANQLVIFFVSFVMSLLVLSFPRFKYRKVVPNDFGLSTEEILAAKDKELNRWVSLKKAVQYRREEEERYDLQAYKRRATNPELKKKLLPSVYAPPEAEEDGEPADEEDQPKKKRKKKRKLQDGEDATVEDRIEPPVATEEDQAPPKKKKKKNREEEPPAESGGFGGASTAFWQKTKKEKFAPEKKKVFTNPKHAIENLDVKRHKEKVQFKEGGPKFTDERLLAFGLNPKKVRNKLKYGGKIK